MTDHFTYQGINDCAIVSICNLTGASYNDVIATASKLNITPDKIRQRGVWHTEILPILVMVTGKPWYEINPRRGQEKYTGIASWHRGSNRSGHMTVIMDGGVIDTDGNVWTIEQYRVRMNYSLRSIFSQYRG